MLLPMPHLPLPACVSIRVYSLQEITAVCMARVLQSFTLELLIPPPASLEAKQKHARELKNLHIDMACECR